MGPRERCHSIVRCTSIGCTICWKRDVNASRNILHLLNFQLLGIPRPVRFRPNRGLPPGPPPQPAHPHPGGGVGGGGGGGGGGGSDSDSDDNRYGPP